MQSEQYFAHSFNTCQVLNVIASYTSTRKMNAFSNETCLNVKHQPFIFQQSKFIWTLIHTRQSDRMRNATAAIVASVVETTHRPGLFSSTTLSRLPANFLYQTCICWSCKTLVTIYWTHLRVNGIWATSFCPEKMNNGMLFLTGCFQR